MIHRPPRYHLYSDAERRARQPEGEAYGDRERDEYPQDFVLAADTIGECLTYIAGINTGHSPSRQRERLTIRDGASDDSPLAIQIEVYTS